MTNYDEAWMPGMVNMDAMVTGIGKRQKHSRTMEREVERLIDEWCVW